MAQDWTNLIGGLAQGFGTAKNAAKERQINEDYKKVLMEQVKAHGKLQEAQIQKLDLEGGLLKWAMGGAAPGAPQVPQASQGNVPPVSQAPATPLPMAMAQGQLGDLSGGMAGGINIPGNPANNISVRQNNPGNLKYVGQEGAAPGTRGFAIFQSPEEGFNALQKQIEIDKGRNLTLSQFANKYAPPYENDTNNWIKNVANMTGATSDTPLANIPTPDLAKAVAKVESSTTIGQPQDQFKPQQMAQTQPQIITPQTEGRGGLTREKFLEGYMKKNFGVEPDEVKDVRYGDHTLIIDKKKGTPLFMIAGQGKTEMVDTTLPDGSIIKRPIVVPPSPLPGGIPVINIAGGGGQSGLMAGPGMQTGPPKMIYEEVTAPGGGKQKIAVPQAQPGTPPIQTEPGGVKMTDLGYTNLMMQGMSKLSEVNKLLFPDGKLDRGLLFKANAPAWGGGGYGAGTTLYSKMYQTVEAALRLETKAAATPGEVQTKLNEYWPNARDTDSTIREKLKDLNEYMDRVGKLYDPTGEMRKSGGVGGVQLTIPTGLSNQKPKTWEELKKGLVGAK